MRRIALWFMSTVTLVVLLFGYHTSTSGAASTGGSLLVQGPPGGGSTGGSPSAPAPTERTVRGPTAQTPYGPVQVQLTVDGGTITGVKPLQYPWSNGTDQQINSRAIPILIDETMQAQSANIDMVSGATYTSNGYLQSLQGALDAAGL